jgi:D-aminoacyl-tRNA deacylase
VRALVQRVSRASVDVDGRRVAEIGPGLLVLLGVTHDDSAADADRLADKVRALRIFPDADGRMNEPLGDARAVLCVSQFTLYGDARKGRRPTWAAAAPGPVSEPLYDALCAELERLGTPVERGVFGGDMTLELVNDGPVTVLLDSGS